MRASRRFLLIAAIALACGLNARADEPSHTVFEGIAPAGGFLSASELAHQADDGILPTAYGEAGEYTPRLFTRFDEGFTVFTEDEEFEFRIKLMEQTDAKLFLPQDQEPARSGLYIPRFRLYFEGHITQSFEYELSLQRSVEGQFDVLDANINYRPAEEFQIRLGRFLVPFSYDWYDHLEQFFITPERALFPLNFGLSREAGIMVWGNLHDGGLSYALGGFSGQIAGLADTNETRDLVGYVNWRPFLEDRDSWLQYLSVGASGAVGQQAHPGEALPLRTSIQSSENDEAAEAASSIFLEYEDDVELLGGRSQAAAHLALYAGQFSFESEVQFGRFQFITPMARPYLETYGYHFTLSYFLTGEEVTGRSIVVPKRPFDPADGVFGIGAIEPFVRFSHVTLGEEVFTAGLADPDDWTRRVSMIDAGWNWYANRYVKFYFDWQLSLYDSPVLIERATDRHVRDSHTLWARAQVFF